MELNKDLEEKMAVDNDDTVRRGILKEVKEQFRIPLEKERDAILEKHGRRPGSKEPKYPSFVFRSKTLKKL
eukprot:1192246-Prorocentrum_minimum.AAC.1